MQCTIFSVLYNKHLSCEKGERFCWDTVGTANLSFKMLTASELQSELVSFENKTTNSSVGKIVCCGKK